MKIGFIGTGNMGTAIIKGYIAGNPGVGSDISAFDADLAKAAKLAEELGIASCATSQELVEKSDIVVLAVKPNVYDIVIQDIVPVFTDDKVIISMAAGIDIRYIEKFFPVPVKVIRIMPNTPALVNEGMTAICRNEQVTDEEFEAVKELFRSIGKVEAVDESLIHAVIGVSGSSPAYVYMFIEALAEVGITNGMPREQSYRFAAQSVLGAAKMVMETGIHPDDLRDAVCSPGGATIEAVRALQANGFRNDIFEGAQAAIDKSKLMTK